jgi:hypothetical protein
MMPCIRAAILLAALFLATGLNGQEARAAARGATLYVNRVVAAPQGDVSLGTLVRSPGPLSAAEQEALSRTVAVLGNAVQFVPSSVYQGWIEAAFGPDAIIVGSRTILVPKGTAAESQAYLLDRLGDYLVAQKLVSNGIVEMAFAQGILTGAPPQDGTPAYQVRKSVRAVEVSFLLTGSAGGSFSGKVTLPPVDDGAVAQAVVKPGSQVRVVFRRGPITVEVPGRTLGAASPGDDVKVSVTESHKTFTGRMLEGKAVNVDLP